MSKKNSKPNTDNQVLTTINWETVYSDLSTRTAKALRQARIHPEKLPQMTDGEILAVEGIGDKGLEEIRDKYPAGEKIELKQEEIKPETSEESSKTDRAQWPVNKRHLFRNGKKIKTARTQVDKNKLYQPKEAIELLKKINIAKFNATVTLHLNLKERLPKVEINFPYSTGKTKKIEIATDSTIAKIEKGQLDFDILIATPQMMPKLAKYARILGPKGLMPNPKMSTVTNDPEKKKKELEGGKTIIKSEPKFPLMHVNIGKIEQKTEELVDNLETVIDAVKPKNIISATLASTMSPGIKVQV